MCGIVGAVAQYSIAPSLLNILSRLEYRGYDSAGIVVINDKLQFKRHRTLDKINHLQALLNTKPLIGHIGLAHTRWATHGKPSKKNAHPHIAGKEIAVVHNGIIENYDTLRKRLIAEGCEITSETDSELIAHLVLLYIKSGKDFLTAVQKTVAELEGAFAIGVLHASEPDHLIAVRSGSPLIIGLGLNENYIASDHHALLPVTNQFIYLQEGDIADVYQKKVNIYDGNGEMVKRPIHVSNLNQEISSKGKYQHFMLKEIFEQPKTVLATLEDRITRGHVLVEAFGKKAPEIFKHIRHIQIVACGTSYHAGLVGRYWFEEIAKISCQVEIASEYRYRPKVVEPDTLFITISQSGETADTLAALRVAKKLGYIATLCICNVPNSSLVRESELTFLTHAGLEIGVATTKAFVAQLTSLFLLSLALGHLTSLEAKAEALLVNKLIHLPKKIEQALLLDPSIKNVAYSLVDKYSALFLARGIQFPVAMEGALKLKEISYIHAEAYPAGELKHGPIALIDQIIPIIVLAPADELLKKLKSNLEEILARGGHLIIFSDDSSGIKENMQTQVLTMPSVDRLLAPIVYVVALQLLAYHVALLKGTDIDQPRNLAKSVTVE